MTTNFYENEQTLSTRRAAAKADLITKNKSVLAFHNNVGLEQMQPNMVGRQVDS